MADLQFLADEWPAISRRLDEALLLAPAERGPWLEGLGEPASVKDKLRQLLDGAGAAEGDDYATLPKLQHVPSLAGDAAAAAGIDTTRPGSSVGPYRLLAELGQGGMGAVWLAERSDGQPRRKVALKLPHVGWAPGLAARLARERDILASLEHPNIARLYDAGIDALGRPYLALEYVDGTPIDRHCAAHALPLRERLALVLQVAAAVSHAHARLVVHRDLKPSNILVTASGDVRLLDFGIAKLLEDGSEASDVTRQAGRALTPDYASPEQIRGETIGTASDVYSLGVVTYEVLAGVRPYRLGRGPDFAAAIAESEPAAASRAAGDAAARRQLAGDLDAILTRVLKKEIEQRYASIQDFAADIERHLRGEPVQARPNAPWYLAERWVRRHKLESAGVVAIAVAVPAGAAAQAAVLAALAVGAGLALWQARVARGQAERARAEAARAQQVKDFALSIFEGANTESGAGAATSAADMLSWAQARVDRELTAHPETAVELMTAIGDGLTGLGRLEEAENVLGRAVTRARRELGADHPRTLAASVLHGAALVYLDRPDEGRALLEPAVPLARRLNDTHALVDALRWLSTADFSNADLEAGMRHARAAVDVLAVPGARPRKVDHVTAWASLASALNVCDQAGVADAARRALAHAREVHGADITETTLSIRIILGKGLAAEGRLAEALEELASVFADSTAFLGADHPRSETIANHLGQVRLEAGDAAGAIEAFRTQIAVGERRGQMGNSIGLGHSALARALLAAGRHDEAVEHGAISARVLADASGALSAFALRSRSLHALALLRAGRRDDAEAAFAELADAPWTGSDGAAHGGRLAELRSLQGRYEEAATLAQAAVEGLRGHSSAMVRARAALTLGEVLLAGGDAAGAAGALEAAMNLYAVQIVVSADHAAARARLAQARASA